VYPCRGFPTHFDQRYILNRQEEASQRLECRKSEHPETDGKAQQKHRRAEELQNRGEFRGGKNVGSSEQTYHQDDKKLEISVPGSAAARRVRPNLRRQLRYQLQ
jgi:hypothetical protein